jgi:transposase
MSRFLTASHAASWAGLCPGTHESAGKRPSGRTRFANRSLRQALVESARGAVRKRGSYLAAQYRRLVKRCGDKKAIVAVAHSILVIAYHLLREARRIASSAATTLIISTPTASPATTPNGWPRSATSSP